MKYNWSTHTVGRQMQIWLCLLVFIVSIFSVTLINVQHAFADQNAQWIDKVTIVIGTTRYVDSDPFDDLDYYAGNYRNGKCPDVIKIDNMTDMSANGGTQATLEKQKVVEQTGTCAPDGSEHVTLSNSNARWVNVYQLDADHVFMPYYHAFDGQSQGGSSVVLKDGLFERFTNDNEECRRDNNVAPQDSGNIDAGKCMVFDRKSNGKLDIVPPTSAGTSVWVTTNPNEHDAPIYKYSLCPTVVGQDLPCKIITPGNHLVFANNRVFTKPPDVAAYNITGTTDEAAAGNAQVKSSCQSNNPAIVIGWLICGVIDGLDGAVDTGITVVEDLLSFNGDDYRNDEALHTTWSLFRAIASFSLLGVALVMIIGQAIGGGE